MGFPISNLFSIRSFLLAGAQTCKLFENDLMATGKRSKEVYSYFDREDLILTAEHINFKCYSIEREVI